MLENNKKTMSFLRFLLYIVITIFSAFIASLAFPSKFIEDGLPFLAFFYLVPLFWIIFTSSFSVVWFYGLIYGFTFYLFYNYWLETFHPLAILIAPILESFQYVILFLILRLTKLLFKKHYSIFSALFYTSYLYLTQQGFLAYPYGNITSAIYEYTSFIQIVSITGIWGLAFIMVLPQASLAKIIEKKSIKEEKITFLISLSLIMLNWVSGCFIKNYYDNKEAKQTIKVALIQHSADTWKGGYSQYKMNFENLKELTEEAMLDNPDFVVWSETAFVPSVRWHLSYPNNVRTSALVDDFISFGSNLGVPLITGNPEGVIKDKELAPILESGEWNWKTYNTVIVFASSKIEGIYRKQHLVPFTEYFPYEKELPWLYDILLANDYKWWEVGEEATVFEHEGIKFSTPICFEDMFGYLNAEFVKNGADMLINLSNDFWSGSVQAEKQHLQLSIFRAIENRRPLLRSTNSGITCLVLPSGEIINELEPFIMTSGIYSVPLYQKEGLTFYTRHVDLFAKLFIVASVFSSFYSISVTLYERQKKKKEREEYLSHLFEKMEDWQ